MQLKIYQIDAFATKTFEGNPAAVVPLAKIKEMIYITISKIN